MPETSNQKSRFDVFQTVRPYIMDNRRLLALGCLLAFAVVAIRVALPWPLKAILHQWVDPSEGPATGVSTWFDSINPTVVNAAFFLGLLMMLGWVDYWQRLYFARFSINVAHDLRLAAVDAAVCRSANQFDKVATGDLVSRLIGDLARFKSGLKGFLVHVATNGLYFVGVMAVLFYVDLKIGIVMSLAGLLIGVGTWWGATATYQRAKRYRQKEGDLAESIQRATGGRSGSADFAVGSRESGSHEAALTQIQGRTTWFSHAIFGVAVVACLILGGRAVEAGTLEATSMVIFVLYALMLRAPMVQLSRQGARTGKILACLVRINDVIDTDKNENNRQADGKLADLELAELNDSLEIQGIVVRAKGYRKRLLGPITVTINAGERVLVLGDRAAGKTCFLQAIRGTMPPASGSVRMDGRNIAEMSYSARLASIGMLADSVHWSKQRIGKVVDPEGTHPPDLVFNLITRLGGKQILRRLKRGLSTKLASSHLSFNEQKILLLTRLLLAGPSLLLLDHPCAGMSRFHEEKVLRTILRKKNGRTIILTSTHTRLISKFDRVIQFRRGRCVFNGTPAQWKAQLAIAKEMTARKAGAKNASTDTAFAPESENDPPIREEAVTKSRGVNF